MHDIANGLGYVYMTNPDGVTISASQPNNIAGVRALRSLGANSAPFAANKSAVGSLTILTVPGVGSITAVSVNGVDQIGAPIVCTGLTPEQVAELVADSIVSFTPGSGYDYTAVQILDTVYIFAPPEAGDIPNGYAIGLTDTGGPVVTFSTVSFANGSDETGTYDSLVGSRFFLNADYDANGISGGLPATPTSLLNSVEITKYFIVRGQQVGIFVSEVTADTNAINDTDRRGFVSQYNITPQIGPTETVVKLNPVDFVDGDLVYLRAADPAYTITIESAPVVSVPVIGNIYLTNDTPWVSDKYTTLQLQFKNIDGIGPTFTEVSRSVIADTTLLIGQTLYVSSEGDDLTSEPYNLRKHYSSLDGAMNVAQPGDTIVLCPGTWTTTNPLGLSHIENLCIYMYPGAVISGSGLFQGFRSGFKICGNGDIYSTGANNFSNDPFAFNITLLQCNILQTGNTVNTGGGGLYIECATSFSVDATIDPLGTGIFSMIGTGALQAYNVKIIAPEIYLNISAGGGAFGPGFWFQELIAGSKIEIIGNITNLGAGVSYSVIVYNVELSTIRINGNISDQTTYISGSGNVEVVTATDNLNWGAGSEGYGFYITGNILTATRKSIRLVSGRLDFKGNITDFSAYAALIPYSIELGKSASGNPSRLDLSDGKAVYTTALGALFRYINLGTGLSDDNVIRLKNYVVVVAQFLGYSDDAPASYELLSAYSTMAADVSVANSITGTTLVVDAAIT